MNFFSRLAELLDLDELLGREPDIETELAQSVTSLERVAAAARGYAAAVIATERQISRELQQARRAVERCQHRVLEAIARDRADMAERASARQHHYEEKAQDLKSESELAQEATLKAKLLLGRIHDLIGDVRERQRLAAAQCRIIVNQNGLYRASP